MKWLPALGALAALGACGGGDFVVVTVNVRPAVHDADALTVTLANEGSMRTDTLPLSGHSFPVTFSIDASGRSGALTISVDAVDSQMQVVGRGTTTTTLDSDAVTMTLDSADFVVNTDFAGDQELSTDFEANGVQLGAQADGSFTVAFRGSCDGACDMLGRRFDHDGVPLESAVAASANQFALTTTLADSTSTPSATGSQDVTMAFWDFESSDGTASGVACQRLDSDGQALAAQQSVANDANTDVVSAAALGNNNFIVTWNAILSTDVVRSVVVDKTCSAIPGTLVQVSGGVNDGRRAHVAANGSNTLFAWIENGAVHVRAGDQLNRLTAETTFLNPSAAGGDTLEHVRVGALGDGFAVVVRHSGAAQTDPGVIELYRTDINGVSLGPPTIVTDKAGSDFDSVSSFGVASRSDGALIVVWHACGDNGDGEGCGVFGRVLRDTGVPVGDPFVLATTTAGDQKNPSAVGLDNGSFAVAWNDASQAEPDHSGLAVRARVIFPAFDDAKAVLGAACDDGNPCGEGLICDPGSDGVQRCFEQCDPTMPPLCSNGGTCSDGGCEF